MNAQHSRAALTILALSLSTGIAQAQPVLISSNTVIGGMDWTLDGLDIIVQGATLTIDGEHTFRSLIVRRNAGNQPGVVTHTPGYYDLNGAGLRLHIQRDLTLEGPAGTLVGSRIDANSRGYVSGIGPGVAPFSGSGVCCGRGGSGHGGAGGTGSNGFQGGPAYGSSATPAELGSGGTPRFAASNAGSGGGALSLFVGGTFQLDGVIQADGGTCFGDNGAPSGGSIRIDAGSILGSGDIHARGGSNLSGPTGGGGGGGRVAITTCTLGLTVAQSAVTGGSGFQQGQIGSLTILQAPIITQQPSSKVSTEGRAVHFTAAAVGAGLITYQWLHDGVPLTDDDRFSGAMAPVLTIQRAIPADRGLYEVWLTSECGQAGSERALLQVFCRADWDGDYSVTPADLAAFITDYSSSLAKGVLDGDFDGNGIVDNLDAVGFMQAWFEGLGAGC